MKYIFTLLLLTPLIGIAQTNQSTLVPIPGFYIGTGYGWFNSVNGDDKFSGNPKETFFMSATAGATFMQILRAEAEFIHLATDRVRDLDPANTRLSAVMFNGYAGLPVYYVRPYIGAGIGFGWMDLDYPNQPIEQSGIRSCFVLQGMLGVDIDIPASPVKLSAQWRSLIASQYDDSNDDEHDTTEDDLMSLQSSIFEVKIRYQF